MTTKKTACEKCKHYSAGLPDWGNCAKHAGAWVARNATCQHWEVEKGNGVNNLVDVGRDRMRVRFERFGPEEYELFLKCKKLPEQKITYDEMRETYVIDAPARFAELLGAKRLAGEGERSEIAGHLWDYQRWIVETALDARRFAIWADCGQGKTPMGLEWLRLAVELTGKRGLLFAPLNIIGQWMEEAEKFYGAAGMSDCETWPGMRKLETREEMIGFCRGDGLEEIGIVNYEKMVPGVCDELRMLGAVALDESSILKTGGGVTKWNMIKSCRGIEYKLSLTATPAPNDAMEYASQAAFLEKLRHEGEILWTWFSRDKRGEWMIKPHAKEAFFRFMAGWSIYLRNPAAYGFRDNVEPPPDPEWKEMKIKATDAQWEAAHKVTMAATGDMVATERMGIRERSKLSQIAKGFCYQKGTKAYDLIDSRKPEMVATIARLNLKQGLPVLIWTVFDAEAEILREHLGDEAEYLSGGTPERDRQGIIDRFRHGQTMCLVSKARMLGYGLNFHHVGAMIFSGWDDSFEAFYQALRRAWRRGQMRRLRVYLPVIESLEGAQLRNVQAKARRWEADTALQEKYYSEAMSKLIGGNDEREAV